MKRFIPKKHTQTQLTKIFSALAKIPAQDLRYLIWFNPTDANSLRLSLKGYSFVVQTLKYNTYSFALSRPMTNRNLLDLETYFGTMYYLLENNKLIIFDEAEASMLALQDGDILGYLHNIKINNPVDN